MGKCTEKRTGADPVARAALAILMLSGMAGVAGCREAARAVRVVGTDRLMGAPWTITVYADSGERADAAIAAAFAEVARLEGILSDYDPRSELSRLSDASPTTRPVGDDLWRVLELAVRFRDASDGAFDPTIGPLTTLWRQARRSGRLPNPAKLAAALGTVGPSTLRLDPGNRSVELKASGMRLDLGGIGTGYAVDAAMRMLVRHGIRSAMIDASGDIAVSGPPPGRRGWRIAVDPVRPSWPQAASETATAPPESIEIADAAVTTSGDAFQSVEIDGVRYSHVVDPRTGLGVVGRTAVTVIAEDCTTADALATAASVLGPKDGLRLVESFANASARFQWAEEGVTASAATSAWPTDR